jgi:hypothetical protein
MDLVLKGKKMVIGIIILVLIGDIIFTLFGASLLTYSSIDSARKLLVQGAFRVILEIILSYLLYKGNILAKWLLSSLLFLQSLLCFILILPQFNILLLLLSICLITLAGILFFSPAVKAFTSSQKKEG